MNTNSKLAMLRGGAAKLAQLAAMRVKLAQLELELITEVRAALTTIVAEHREQERKWRANDRKMRQHLKQQGR
ncbi:MAG: hypothetical protein WAV09_03440 [Minisyncoccia bacterium]